MNSKAGDVFREFKVNMYSLSFQDGNLTYAKLIQELLTQNIVQKNGNALSLVHIRNEMSAVVWERGKVSLILSIKVSSWVQDHN